MDLPLETPRGAAPRAPRRDPHWRHLIIQLTRVGVVSAGQVSGPGLPPVGSAGTPTPTQEAQGIRHRGRGVVGNPRASGGVVRRARSQDRARGRQRTKGDPAGTQEAQRQLVRRSPGSKDAEGGWGRETQSRLAWMGGVFWVGVLAWAQAPHTGRPGPRTWPAGQPQTFFRLPPGRWPFGSGRLDPCGLAAGRSPL